MRELFKDKDLIKRISVVVLYFLITMIIAIPIALLWKVIMKNASSDFMAISYQVFLYVILLALFIPLMKNEFKLSIEPLKRKSAKTTILDILLGCVIVYAAMYVGSIITLSLGGEGNSENQEYINELLKSPYTILMIPVVGLIGPIVEELVFRGALQGSLKKLKMPAFLTIIIAGSLFGLMHVIEGGDYIQVPSYILGGIAFGYIYEKSENIYVPISVHIIYNSVSLWLSYIYILAEELGLMQM